MKAFLSMLAVAILTVSCNQTVPNSGTAKEVTAILGEVRGQVDQMQKAQQEMMEAQHKLLTQVETTYQFISDRINNADFYNLKNNVQNEFTELVSKELVTVKTLLPPPSPESMLERERILQAALRKSEEDKKTLEAYNQRLALEAAHLKGQTDLLQSQVNEKEQTLTAKTLELNAKVTKLADAEADIRIKAAEANTARENAAKEAASKARLKVAMGFMYAGGIMIVASLILFLLAKLKEVLWPGIVGGITLILMGWSITYVEDLLQQLWFRITVGASMVGVIAIVIYMCVKAWKARKKAELDARISIGAIGALQEAKNDDAKLGTQKFTALAPHLEEWFVKDDGKPDEEVQREIDARLVAMNLKNPDGVKVKTPQPSATDANTQPSNG
jgi:hypothetical protein